MKVKKLKELIKKFGGDPTGKNTVAACVDALCACEVGGGVEVVYLSSMGQWPDYHPEKPGQSLTAEETVELVNKWAKGKVQVRDSSSGDLYMGGGYSAAAYNLVALNAQDSSGTTVKVSFILAGTEAKINLPATVQTRLLDFPTGQYNP